MKQFFYYHLIDFSDLREKLQKQDLSKAEERDLLSIVEETLHYRIVSEVLTCLPEEDNEWFLQTYTVLPHKKNFLEQVKAKIEDIEDKIKNIAERVKEETIVEFNNED